MPFIAPAADGRSAPNSLVTFHTRNDHSQDSMPNAGREGAVAAGLNPSTPGYSSTSDWLTNFILTAKTITATAELLPFPYLAAAFGPLVPVLQAVQVCILSPS